MINNAQFINNNSFDPSRDDSADEDILLYDDLTESMKLIFKNIDQNFISDQERVFINFLSSRFNRIESLQNTKFAKVHRQFAKQLNPEFADQYLYDYYQKGNEYIVKLDKIFKIAESKTFRRAIHFKRLDHQDVQPINILYIKRIIESDQQHFLHNQLAFSEDFGDGRISSLVQGNYIFKKKGTDYLTSVIFQQKYGVDLFRGWDENIKKLSFLQRLDIILQITSLIKELHDKHRTHGDIKLDNFVLKDQKVLLIDGENYCRHDDVSKEDLLEFPPFSTFMNYPPELFFETDYNPYKVEIWYLAELILQILANQRDDSINRSDEYIQKVEELLEFSNEELRNFSHDQKQAYYQVFETAQDFQLPSQLFAKIPNFDQIVQLIKRMLSVDPSKRPDIDEVIEKLTKFKPLS